MHYTVLNLEQIKALAQEYAIGEIISFKVLSGGSENTNYLIASNSEQYVLTICEQKSIEETTNLAKLLEHLAADGFSTSKVIRTKNNQRVNVYNDKPVLLKSFLKGKIIGDLPLHLIELIGIQLGKLHQITAPKYLPGKLNYGIESFTDVELYAKNSSFHHWLQKLATQIKPYLIDSIPKALIHSDVFPSNVIIEQHEDAVCIMDFEEATYYYRIFDLGMTIVGICRTATSINLNKVSSLLKGYLQEIKLESTEQNALQSFTLYAAAAMCFWRHKNFNYTNPTSAMKDHYLELKRVADEINDLPRNCFQEMLDELTAP